MSTAGRYINPFTDFGFKKLFGSEPNKDLLIDFLNELLPEKHRLRELSYGQPEQPGNNPADRKAIFDLYCIGQNGERFIVEMQKAKQNYFKDRSVFYASFPIQEQAPRGEWNFKLAAVYLIGILGFVFSEDADEQCVRHEIQLRDQRCKVFYDKLTYIYLEMPNFRKTESELQTNFDKWLYVLKQLPTLKNRPPALQEKVFQKLFDTAEIAKFSPKDKQQYEQSLKYYRDLKNVIDSSFDEGIQEGMEKGRLEGRLEGREEGIQEGMEKGRLEGREEGKFEGKQESMLTIARNMKQAGEPLEKIALFTGLLTAEIAAL